MKKKYCKNLRPCYSLIMELLIDPKETAMDDLSAYASEYEAWLDELEAIVKEHGNPHEWIDKTLP